MLTATMRHTVWHEPESGSVSATVRPASVQYLLLPIKRHSHGGQMADALDPMQGEIGHYLAKFVGLLHI